MNRPTLPPDDSWESDEVWNLVDQANPVQASTTFSTNVVRLARQMPEISQPFWRRLFNPTPLAVFAGAVAAVVVGVTFFSQPKIATPTSLAVVEPVSQSDDFDELQDLAETEALLVAADHLDDFSDQELASLIGL